MTDFIPYPPNGNPKQMHQEFVSVGTKIKAKTTARAGGDAQPLEAESSVMVPHTPDLRPFYLNNFAITTDPTEWGVTTFPNWSKTGTVGNNTTTTNNGRLIFINNGGFQDAALGGIARYIVANAGGLTNFGSTWATNAGGVQEAQGTSGETGPDAVKGYNCNSFSTMQADYVRDYRTNTRAVDGAVMGGNGDGTDVDDWTADPAVDSTGWLPSVFTSDGTATGSARTAADRLDAWTQALNQLDTYITANGLANAQKFHQWDWPAVYAYSSDKTDVNAAPDYDGGYDRFSASTDFHGTTGSLRWVKPDRTNTFDRGFWDYEVNGMMGLGFDGLTWGVSGNTYQEFDDTSGAAEAVKAAYPGTPFVFEASPMQSTGTGAAKVFHPYGTTWDLGTTTLSGEPDQRYAAAAHWGFFPSYYTTEQYSTDAGTNGWSSDGGRWIDNIWWDPSKHEQHIIFDGGYLVRTVSNAPQYTFDELKDLMILAWQHGFVVGVSNLSRSGGSTPTENQDICTFVADLNEFTSSGGIDTSTATHPTGGGAVTRHTNPAAEKAIPTQP